MRNAFIVIFAFVIALGVFAQGGQSAVLAQDPPDDALVALGEALFFDANLSTPPGQSCATCHGPEVGFMGPDSDDNAAGAAYPGAIHTRFGNRKPPTAAYAGDTPALHFDEEEG